MSVLRRSFFYKERTFEESKNICIKSGKFVVLTSNKQHIFLILHKCFYCCLNFLKDCISLSWWRESWAERRSSRFTGQSTFLPSSMVINFGGGPGMPHQEETPRKTQDTLEWLCRSAGLGTPWDSPGGARGSLRGEGSLGVPAQAPAPATRSQLSGSKWVGGFNFLKELFWVWDFKMRWCFRSGALNDCAHRNKCVCLWRIVCTGLTVWRSSVRCSTWTTQQRWQSEPDCGTPPWLRYTFFLN